VVKKKYLRFSREWITGLGEQLHKAWLFPVLCSCLPRNILRHCLVPTTSKAHHYTVPILLGVAFVLFGTGIFFPFFHVQKFWLFDDAVSVVGGIITLFQEGEYFLFAVLSVFTLMFPCAKLGLLTITWIEREHDLTRLRGLHGWVAALGKWSMLDVFVVAILIVAMKSAAVAEIHIGFGLYLFTFSVITTQIASSWIDRRLQQRL
jgi:paraquat-inducible protein A